MLFVLHCRVLLNVVEYLEPDRARQTAIFRMTIFRIRSFRPGGCDSAPVASFCSIRIIFFQSNSDLLMSLLLLLPSAFMHGILNSGRNRQRVIHGFESTRAAMAVRAAGIAHSNTLGTIQRAISSIPIHFKSIFKHSFTGYHASSLLNQNEFNRYKPTQLG